MSDSTPTLERVARAIATALGHDPDGCNLHVALEYPDTSKLRVGWTNSILFEPVARAALDASGNDELVEALKDAREAIASLEDDALGTAFPANVTSNDQGWPIRDELLAKIDAAIARTQEQSDG